MLTFYRGTIDRATITFTLRCRKGLIMKDDFIFRMLERLEIKLDDLTQNYTKLDVNLDIHFKEGQKISEDIKELKDGFKAQAVNLSEYNKQLREHIRRTELLEKKIEPIEKAYFTEKTKANFIAAHWKKIAIVTTVAGTITGIVIGILQIISWFGK